MVNLTERYFNQVMIPGINQSYTFSLLFTILLVLPVFSSIGQVTILYEDFESGTGVFTSTGSSTWQANMSLKYAGTQSLHLAYGNSEVNRLTNTFNMDLSNYTTVQLEFWHIAKIEIGDTAIVELTNDNGQTWTTLDNSQYTGAGYLLWNDQFFDGSYATWDPGNFSTPTNSWWKRETYDLSSFTGPLYKQVKIRLTLRSDASLNKYGWLMDELKVIGLTTGEIDPPVIQHTPQDDTGSPWPIEIVASITDATGIDSAQIFYRVNGGSWNGPNDMMKVATNTYNFYLPGQNQGTTVDYYIKAIDQTTLANTGYHPSGQAVNYHSYEVKNAIYTFPYYEDFETSSANAWTHVDDLTVGNTGVLPHDDWELGYPNKNWLNEPHTGNLAYVTKINGYYSGNSRSSLLTPLFDLSVVSNPLLSFYHKYQTDFGDGCRIDYTLDDGYTWNVLGKVGDSNSNYWYTNLSITSASTPLSRPGWSGSGSISWTQSEYDLSGFVGSGVFIRFRFIFTSTFGGAEEGWVIDDFSIDGVTSIDDVDPPFTELGNIYPSPADRMIFIPISLEHHSEVQLYIYNSLGQKVQSFVYANLHNVSDTRKINVALLPAGNYYLEMITKNGISKTRFAVLH